MNRGSDPATIARNERIARMIQQHPGKTYPEIGELCGVSPSTVSNVANRYGVTRQRGAKPFAIAARRSRAEMTTQQRKAAPKCHICTILTERIDEGVAWVRAAKGPVRVCQSCVERYHPRYILGWVKHPVDGKEGA